MLCFANNTIETINHVKTIRRHWYDDNKWVDKTKPPEDALDWTILRSYNSDSAEE